MQYNSKEYNPDKHDRWRALTVKQPYANDLVTPEFTLDGHTYGFKSIEVRSRNTTYRGDLLICSSANPKVDGFESGVTLGIVELYNVKPVSEFTPEDFAQTRLPQETVEKIKKGFGWMMRNPRPVVEFPIKGQLGIYNLVYTKGCIVEYPKVIVFDKESYDLANRKEELCSLSKQTY